MNNTYIFTEAVGCGKIMNKCLSTFHKYHNEKVNIYCAEEDIKEITPHQNNVIHHVDDIIIRDYTRGHAGTARIFAKVILDHPNTNLIHFDSDVIFRDNCIDYLYDKIDKGYDLIGPYRCYKHNPNNRDDARNRPDVTQTFMFAFNTEKIGCLNYDQLTLMCQGIDFTGQPIIDFFDPVGFHILSNGGKPYYIPIEIFGGTDAFGEKTGRNHFVNRWCDAGDKCVHFACVGSGKRFYEHPETNVPESYKNVALARYALYSALFFENIMPHLINQEEYNDFVLYLKEI